jgi:hypothetical protein
MGDLIWSFSPWIAFIVSVRFGSVYWAAAAGIAVAAVVLVRAISRDRVHMFDVIGLVFFSGLLILVAAIQPSDISTWGRYAQAVAHGTLCLIVFGSVLIDKPFTEPYAREQVPKEVWTSRRFHEFNRRISLVWGLAFLVGTLSLALAGAQSSRQFVLRLLVPFGALFLAYEYTERQAARAGHGTPEHEGGDTPQS